MNVNRNAPPPAHADAGRSRSSARWSRTRGPASLWVAGLVVLLSGPSWAEIVDHDRQMIDGLRQRRLFSLAEAFCLAKTGAATADEPGLADWTVELIRVYADQAVNAVGSERDAAAARADAVADRFETDHADHPRLPLVRVQAALASLALGELSRMEAEVGSQPEQALTRARETIRQAARQLEVLDEQLTELIPVADRRPRAAGALTSAEASSLQQNVRYQWSRSLRNQALCYPPKSPDRLAALTAAVRMLGQPLQVLPSDDGLVPRIRIDQAICHRLLGEFDVAATALAGLDEPAQTPAVRLAARAEAVRLSLAADKTDDALRTLAAGRAIDGVAAAELDFAFLEVYVAKWRAAGSRETREEASEWERKSVATLEFIEQTHGPYWARRAELLLVRVNLRAGSGNVSILDRAARDLYRKGKLDEAVSAYDKAAEAARDGGDRQQAFALGYRAALIQQQRRHYDDAANRFSKLARTYQTNPLSSNAHLTAIVNLAQVAKAEPDRLNDYAALLSEHLLTWSTAETADTARLWLGQLYEARRQWELATENFTAVTTTSEHFPQAVAGGLRCWSRWLEALQAAGEPVEETARAAIRYGQQVLRRDAGELPMEWTELDGGCLVGLARIQLRFLPEGAEDLEPVLRAAVEQAAADADWRRGAQSLLLLTVLRRVDGEQESRQILSQLADASTEQLWELLTGIEQAAADVPRLAPSIGALERDIADRLLKADPPLKVADRRRVQMIQAAALVKLGEQAAALAALAELAKTYPDQAAVQVAYAERLLADEDPQQWRTALDQWRRVASRTKPRTPAWFRAKYSVALAHFKLGDPGAAAKLIRYLQATENLAASGLQDEFAELLARCR